MPQAVPLALYLYNLSAQVPMYDYGPSMENVKFTTIAPGGYGDLTCDIYVPQSRLVPPEFKAFNNVFLGGGGFSVFQGRMDEPGIMLDKTSGSILHVSALGAADILKDDPQDFSYTAQTATQIITDQIITQRSAYLPIDSDFTQVLPNNPAATFSPAFTGKNIEDILNELTNDLGYYSWAVWGHPQHKDAQRLPTWQLYWHTRNTTTPNYKVQLGDILDFDIRPSIEYSYNCVTLLYRDFTSQNPQSVTVQDSRLAGSKAQGTAPFPFRRLRKDVSQALLTSTQATALANALLAQYQNVGYKITVEVGNIADAGGNPIPLWQVRADNNVFIPDLSPIGASFPATFTANTNLFYITQTEFQEQKGSTPTLTLTCDTFYDTTAFQIARIQRTAEQRKRSVKSKGIIQEPGASEIGTVGTSWGANAVSTDTYDDDECANEHHVDLHRDDERRGAFGSQYLGGGL